MLQGGGHVFQGVGDILLWLVHAPHPQAVVELHHLDGRARHGQADGHFRAGFPKAKQGPQLVDQNGVVFVVAVVAHFLAGEAGADADNGFFPLLLRQVEAHFFQQIR